MITESQRAKARLELRQRLAQKYSAELSSVVISVAADEFESGELAGVERAIALAKKNLNLDPIEFEHDSGAAWAQRAIAKALESLKSELEQSR